VRRKHRVLFLALALTATIAGSLAVPQTAQAASTAGCQKFIPAPWKDGNFIQGAGNVSGCAPATYRLMLYRTSIWLVLLATSTEFQDGGGSAVRWDCTHAGTQSYLVRLQVKTLLGLWSTDKDSVTLRVTCP
jgi:hypothetical protein